MKRIAVCFVAFALHMNIALAQSPSAPKAPAPPKAPSAVPGEAAPVVFDLVFHGGTPQDLVEAIERASGRPLNAIIPEEHADVMLPALKMANVTVPRLFEALTRASVKRVKVVTGTFMAPGGQAHEQYQVMETSYGFQTSSRHEDDPAAVWYFVYRKPDEAAKPIKLCRFFKLSDDLETYKIEDITTVVQTGWTLLGITNQPTLKFHPETKVLIAVGDGLALDLIEKFLKELRSPGQGGGGGGWGGQPGPSAAPALPAATKQPVKP